jgi:hypothetical protein
MSRDLESAIMKCPAGALDVRVLRSDTRAPVASAVVRLAETGDRRTQGATGQVSFLGLRPAQYTVQVTDAEVMDEVVAELPQPATATVVVGGHAKLELLVDLERWEIISTSVAEDAETKTAQAAATEDWRIDAVAVEAGGDEETASTDAEAEDWQIADVGCGEAACAENQEPPADSPEPAPEGEDFKIETVAIVDEESGA